MTHAEALDVCYPYRVLVPERLHKHQDIKIGARDAISLESNSDGDTRKVYCFGTRKAMAGAVASWRDHINLGEEHRLARLEVRARVLWSLLLAEISNVTKHDPREWPDQPFPRYTSAPELIVRDEFRREFHHYGYLLAKHHRDRYGPELGPRPWYEIVLPETSSAVFNDIFYDLAVFVSRWSERDTPGQQIYSHADLPGMLDKLPYMFRRLGETDLNASAQDRLLRWWLLFRLLHGTVVHVVRGAVTVNYDTDEWDYWP